MSGPSGDEIAAMGREMRAGFLSTANSFVVGFERIGACIHERDHALTTIVANLKRTDQPPDIPAILKWVEEEAVPRILKADAAFGELAK